MTIRRQQHSLREKTTYVVLKKFDRYGFTTVVKYWLTPRSQPIPDYKYWIQRDVISNNFKHDYYNDIALALSHTFDLLPF